MLLLAEFAAMLSTDVLVTIDGTLELRERQATPGEMLSIGASTLTVCFNFMLASAAIARLLLARRRLRRAALPGGGGHYVQIAHLLAGSTVLYAAGWIPMIIWRHDTFSIPHLSMLFFLVASLPLVIMLHVAWRSHRDCSFILPEISPAADVGSNDSGDLIPTFKPFRRESDGTDWYDSRDAQDDAGVWRRESDTTVVGK
ncbi:hypothetical protein AURDEDRAFT_156006 [Auricularia subglabra TFB-10046 SS5]|nr:hypothetical protein AURDEDRAFT_156006 [Auricularia subglabra TFB-10046 SS5]